MIRPRRPRISESNDDDRLPLTRERLAAYLRLLGYVRPYRARMIVAVIALSIGTILGLLMPLIIRVVVDVVFVEKNLALLNRFTLILTLIFLTQAVFSFVNRYNIGYTGERVVADLRQQLYDHLVSLSLRFFADRRTGELVSRVSNDVTLLQAAVTENLVSLLQQSLTLIGGIIFLLWLDWRLTAIILLGIPPITLTMVYLGRKIRKASTEVQDRLAEASAVIDESVGGIRIVKSFAREAYEVSRFTAKIEETFSAAMKRVRISATLGPTIGFMAFMSITITIWFGGYEVIQGRLSPGGLVAFLIYTMLVAGPIAAFSSLYSQFQAALGATQRIFELLDLRPEVADAPDAYSLPRIIGRVTFDDVSFEYDSAIPVLHRISIDVQPGQIVALVGPSGAGKTTLVNLIPRFYDVTQGEISIDGRDIRQVTKQSLREQIGIVPQEAALFSETIRENIRYGNLQAPKILDALAKNGNLSTDLNPSIIRVRSNPHHKNVEVFFKLTQRRTQTAHYWQDQFQVKDKDTEAIYQQILEHGHPLHLDDIGIMLVRRHCNEEELESRSELQDGKLYQPDESFAVGDRVIFPSLEFSTGTVVSSRQGQHPEYPTFSVISVDLEGSDSPREFVSNFPYDHPLNVGEGQSLANLQGLMTPEEIFETYQDAVRSRLQATFSKNDDFVTFHDLYFLKDLLPDFHEGLFNIADAAIDINDGPLSIDALIEQMGLVENGSSINDTTRFSVNYQLANDDRFDDVGPAGQVSWYLDRMAPPEAHYRPRRLQVGSQTYDSALFDEDLRDLLQTIDDEATNPNEIEPVEPDVDKIVVVPSFPHWRVGTLPLTPKTQSFFPQSEYNPVRFQFVDGRTGNPFPGWTVSGYRYVYGLGEWYKKNKLPVGAYITIKRSKDPMQVVIDYQSTRTQRDWVRMAAYVGNRLSFQMSPAALACKYDELMIIGDSDIPSLDTAWVHAEQRKLSVYDLLCDIFPELSKLNPQSTVHAKTLYSAVNVTLRAAPGIVFQELVTRPCFIPMNHGYWTYDPNLRS